MHLSIYSLKKVLFEGEAEAVNVKTVGGEITVLDNHRPLLSMLATGVLTVRAQGAEKFFEVKSGFIEVMPENAVRLLVDEAS